MSSEPSESAKEWVRTQLEGTYDPGRYSHELGARGFDIGYSEGEKKGTAAGYLAALREVRAMWGRKSHKVLVENRFIDWLDRRIQAEEGR